MVRSTETSEHYQWGKGCDGWHLLKTSGLSVIKERMPAGTSEAMHYHVLAQQLFYVLSGEAFFELNDKLFILGERQSIHVAPGMSHRITNKSDQDLIFLVISEPKAHGDRIEITE